ncbi:colicin E3/pyocin S6 family cytotoxin [Paludibacterium purpuratum]|uniref:colicin E3/pyocin S6 family cytotoxin n=1 Tax=Paludibacterium purpuratum TaxID=1144873 RepID=UPI00105DFF88
MPPKPIPRPSILDECTHLGAFNSERRWRSPDGERLYTWDSLHGEIEVYNKRGRHLGVVDPVTGNLIKDAVRGRKIDV